MSIAFQNVSVTYPGATEAVLRNLDFEVPHAAFLAIVGANGSGKTTLTKLITGIIPRFIQATVAGNVIINEKNVTHATLATLAHQVGYIYQDFEQQLVKPKVIDDVGFSALNYGHADYQQRAEKALAQLDISHLAQRFIWELSGGEQHLVALAGLLALNPNIIIVDEPVSQLDPVHARLVYEKLAFLHRSQQKTIIVIEHHSDFIAEYCTHMALIHDGAVRWCLPVMDGFANEADLAQSQIPLPTITRILRKVTEYGHHIARPFAITYTEGLRILQQHKTQSPIHFSAEVPPQRYTASKLLTLSHIHQHITLLDKQKKVVLADVSVTFHSNQRVAIVGANGAGKSSLLRIIAGMDTPHAGSMTFHSQLSQQRGTSPVAYVCQRPQEMFVTDSVRQELALSFQAQQTPDTEQLIHQLLERCKLQHLDQRDPRLLSGGQMRRVALAIGLSLQPSILVIDEPTASLDEANRAVIVALLHNLSSATDAVIIATHDMELVANWATRVLVMCDGQIIADTIPNELFTQLPLMHDARITPPPAVHIAQQLALSPLPTSEDALYAFFQSH